MSKLKIKMGQVDNLQKDFFYFYSNGSGHTVSRLLTCIYSVHKSFTFPCEENNILFKPHMGTMYMPKGFGLLVLL